MYCLHCACLWCVQWLATRARVGKRWPPITDGPDQVGKQQTISWLWQVALTHHHHSWWTCNLKPRLFGVHLGLFVNQCDVIVLCATFSIACFVITLSLCLLGESAFCNYRQFLQIHTYCMHMQYMYTTNTRLSPFWPTHMVWRPICWHGQSTIIVLPLLLCIGVPVGGDQAEMGSHIWKQNTEGVDRNLQRCVIPGICWPGQIVNVTCTRTSTDSIGRTWHLLGRPTNNSFYLNLAYLGWLLKV